MKYYKDFVFVERKTEGKRKVFDNNIYTFDIETTSYIKLKGKIYKSEDYQKFNKKQQEACQFFANMYIWMFGINNEVYYGRYWSEFLDFITYLDKIIPEKKYIFVHNLAFEFQFLKSVLQFENVTARKSHKVMTCEVVGLNYEFRCSYMMSNCALKNLPKLYMLDVEKMTGDLDYNQIRHNETVLSDKELKYCENDCLVVYAYIKRMLETYGTVKNIPITSTGQVRRELKDRIMEDYKYKRLVQKSINTDPHVYNLLQEAFMGGYTHANWIYTDEVLYNIDSWDFTSSYPYVLVTHRYPSTRFMKCELKKAEYMSKGFAYLLVVRFKNIECKYYNNFISQSKCRNIKGGRYDNGRIIKAEELEITLTDIDFKLILDTYKCDYQILESYYSKYNYLPKQFINFVLEKYVNKTEYKGVAGKEINYQKEKNKYNALYGMSVTNTIRDEVIYDNISGWSEQELTNEEIQEKLYDEYKKGFLSFAYGVWVTAYARNNLIRNIIKLDEYVVYCDTDSIKLLQGYDKNIIQDYNKFVTNKIEHVSKLLKIDINKYKPKDIKGDEHLLGIFDFDGHYEEFITQGAKKYAVIEKKKISKITNSQGEYIEDVNVLKTEGEYAYCLEITVAGVPKRGCKALKKLEDFKDDLIFRHEVTGKNMLFYVENQEQNTLIDSNGVKCIVNDKSGCSIIPTTYVLGKSVEYANLISDDSSKRAIYKEVRKYD